MRSKYDFRRSINRQAIAFYRAQLSSARDRRHVSLRFSSFEAYQAQCLHKHKIECYVAVQMRTNKCTVRACSRRAQKTIADCIVMIPVGEAMHGTNKRVLLHPRGSHHLSFRHHPTSELHSPIPNADAHDNTAQDRDRPRQPVNSFDSCLPSTLHLHTCFRQMRLRFNQLQVNHEFPRHTRRSRSSSSSTKCRICI